ncbi:ATP-binding protein [Geitlerinema splendidum]|nr:ATP-binding protein [Geitlerinema splendidum]
MKWLLEEKAIACSLAAILLLLGLVNLVSSKNTTELVENANQVQSTYNVLGTLTDFYAAMSVAESGRRGYIFSGREEELSRHQTAVEEMQVELSELQQYAVLNGVQQQRLQQLEQLTRQRMVLFEQSIELYQHDRSLEAMQTQHAITDRSVQIREQIQSLLTEIKNTENQQLQDSLKQARRNIQYRSTIERAGILLIVVVACGVVWVFYWGQRRRQQFQELEKTLAQEQELSNLKLRLFSMISHEFRTPLSVILVSSQLLTEILEFKIEPSQLKNLYRIQNSAKLMNRLITDLLTLTRAEAGKLEHQPEWLDIEEFCLNLLDDFQSSHAVQHDLQFTSQGEFGRVYLDEKLLYSIMSNLLLNAIKYSPSGTQVTLKLEGDSEQIVFEVEDQGMGISEDEQANIFNPFYRGQNVEGISGSGLGLAVVSKCVEIQKGRIEVNSHVGEGTRFRVYIPRTDKNAIPAGIPRGIID